MNFIKAINEKSDGAKEIKRQSAIGSRQIIQSVIGDKTLQTADWKQIALGNTQ